mmetsp:Transcript_3585/g.7451  ORF Transcript_3585/g.7451 Transcript_3585/m.7451 type:complete len:83 (+) Transcript_3585:73-321(+)
MRGAFPGTLVFGGLAFGGLRLTGSAVFRRIDCLSSELSSQARLRFSLGSGVSTVGLPRHSLEVMERHGNGWSVSSVISGLLR